MTSRVRVGTCAFGRTRTAEDGVQTTVRRITVLVHEADDRVLSRRKYRKKKKCTCSGVLVMTTNRLCVTSLRTRLWNCFPEEAVEFTLSVTLSIDPSDFDKNDSQTKQIFTKNEYSKPREEWTSNSRH